MEKHLKTFYGYNDFREVQKEVINDLLENNNVFCVLPTGGGKSLLYQFPATYTNKISIVISPLISLMNDQVINLGIKNIKACCLNSEADINLNYLQECSIVYTTPEYLCNNINIFKSISDKICLFAIDEAHCVSQWSHDFRQSYQQLGIIKETYPDIPILAVTATATPIVIEEMETFLNVDNLVLYLGGSERTNLFISVDSKENFKIDYSEPTIIYVQTRKECENLYSSIIESKNKCLKYHGGLSQKEKNDAHEQFSSGKINTIVATISFGMGIDKSNIRNVINYGIPTDIETYYQEIGRAGRDGLKSSAILYYDNSDFNFANYIINTTKDIKQQERKRNALSILRKYLNEHELCRHKMIDYYFENGKFCTTNQISKTKCNMCDNCTKIKNKNLINITSIAEEIYNYIVKYNIVCGIIKLTNTITDKGSPKLKNKPCLFPNYDNNFIKNIIEKMITKENLIYEKWEKFGNVLIPNKNITEPIFIVADNINVKSNSKISKIRTQLSKKYKMIESVFLNDKVLQNIENNIPRTIEDLWLIDGITENFIIKYGAEFINKINNNDKKPTKQCNTIEETYNLYKEGKTIDEIANIRDLKPLTIENHIINKWSNNKDEINKDFAKLTKKIEDEIISAVEKVGFEKLRPIKDIISKDITYFQIRTVLIEC